MTVLSVPDAQNCLARSRLFTQAEQVLHNTSEHPGYSCDTQRLGKPACRISTCYIAARQDKRKRC